MNRRVLLCGIAALPAQVALSMRVQAQQLPNVRRLGVLTPSAAQWDPEATFDELRKLGHQPGKSLLVDVRSADRELDRLPALAAQMATSGVDVIVAVNTPAARAAMAVTSTVPIVIGVVADPVMLGFANSLSKPGRNVTGVANMATDLVGKRLEILREAIPTIRRIVTHYHPEEPISAPQMRILDQAATGFGIEFRHHPVRTLPDIEQSLRRAESWPADALLRLAGQGLTLGSAMAALAIRSRLPAMVLTAADVRAGGFISYFADHSALWRRVAHQVHRVLAGASPGDLPFEQPTKFELAINLRTARLLGISVPDRLLDRADEVIE